MSVQDRCSACGRKLRIKIVPGGLGGNYGTTVAKGYTDWLNHTKDCPRYGLAPDLPAIWRIRLKARRHEYEYLVATDDRQEAIAEARRNLRETEQAFGSLVSIHRVSV